MTNNCPKCNAELTTHPTHSPKRKEFCPNCQDMVWKDTCVACDQTFYSVGQKQFGGVHWHNHRCDQKKLDNRDRVLDQEERNPRTPTEIERYEEGLKLMEHEE